MRAAILTPGDQVQHLPTGRVMTVKKVGNLVATCILAKGDHKQITATLTVDTAVCNISNLIKL